MYKEIFKFVVIIHSDFYMSSLLSPSSCLLAELSHQFSLFIDEICGYSDDLYQFSKRLCSFFTDLWFLAVYCIMNNVLFIES